MDLVKVYIVGVQTLKTAFDLVHDVFARKPPFVGANRLADEKICVEADLGGQDQLIAPFLDSASGDFLRSAGGVDVGGIEEVATGLDEAVDDSARLGLFGLASKGHASQAEFGDL